MKRITDKHYGTYSIYSVATSGIYVKCPKCNGLGFVTVDNKTAYFKCTNCGKLATKERKIYGYDVHNHCEQCGQYYRVDITEKSKQHFHMLYVHCPFCGYGMSGVVHKMVKSGYKNDYHINDIQNACEPFFGLELWFLATFDSKFVWALNREHLAYLIDYVSADLREKPMGVKVLKTQGGYLPAFIKTAKNREKIVKLLNDMQKK